METDSLLKYHWNVFLSHICEFYPLDKDFIAKYEYELDWCSISKNKIINWDTDFLTKYADRFMWHELAWNDSIVWTIDRIEKFKKRLDWYYLGRNKNLPINEDFINKYSKKLLVSEDNPLLTDSLKKKYNIKTIPANNHDTQDIKSYSPNDFDRIFKEYTFYHNQKIIYTELLLPIVEQIGIKKIFEDLFDYSQRYYFLTPIQNDERGLTPEFVISGNNLFQELREGRGLFQIGENLTLINGSLQEGPDRLYEVPRLSSFSYYTILLVSENVKSVLEQFKLPNHIFHPVKLHPKKITTSTKYYILHLELDTLTKDLDYNSQDFYFKVNSFKSKGAGPVNSKILNYSDYEKTVKQLNEVHDKIGYSVKVYPNNYLLTTDYDMYSYSVHSKIVINEFLKEALEKHFPGQMDFLSAQLWNIKIDQNKYDQKRNLTVNTKQTSKLSYQDSLEDKFYYQKVERLESDDAPIDITILDKDKFTKKQTELNVIFPKIFKNNYTRKSIKVDGYELLPINKFYIQNEYADRFPETYKSVVVAENGIGDSINLLLERDSDHIMQNKLFEFLHETGEYEEI